MVELIENNIGENLLKLTRYDAHHKKKTKPDLKIVVLILNSISKIKFNQK